LLRGCAKQRIDRYDPLPHCQAGFADRLSNIFLSYKASIVRERLQKNEAGCGFKFDLILKIVSAGTVYIFCSILLL
jgi:hypothetical protein